MKKIVDKRALWRLVNKRINRVVHSYHVFSVISILFEEMISDLKAGKKIKIFNFCTLSLNLNNNGEKIRYMNIFTREIQESNSRKKLKFKIAPKFKNKIIKFLDVDKL